MKITAEIIRLLKNFSEINRGIYFNVGNKLETISNAHSIYASVQIDEHISTGFGIYDLNKFLMVLGTFSQQLKGGHIDVDIYPHCLDIWSEDKKYKIQYNTCIKDLLCIPPGEISVDKKPNLEFDLTEDRINWVNKVGGILSLPDISFQSLNGNLVVMTRDFSRSDADSTFTILEEGIDGNFQYVLSSSMFRLVLPGDYKVKAYLDEGFIHFQGSDTTLQYWIVLKTNSYHKT